MIVFLSLCDDPFCFVVFCQVLRMWENNEWRQYSLALTATSLRIYLRDIQTCLVGMHTCPQHRSQTLLIWEREKAITHTQADDTRETNKTSFFCEINFRSLSQRFSTRSRLQNNIYLVLVISSDCVVVDLWKTDPRILLFVWYRYK